MIYDRARAMADPHYHRWAIFGQHDAMREKRLGRTLLLHECQGRIRGPQSDIIDRVELAVNQQRGEVITVLCSRQAGKNETAAHIHDRFLIGHESVPGSTWIRMAPTYKPQLVTSMDRIEKFYTDDPFLVNVRSRHGYMKTNGHANLMFLSAGQQAHVIGATASVCLDVDEAHTIDADKYEDEIHPFTADTNAPTVMWGIAGDKLDLLHAYRERNEGTDRLMLYPASVWADLNPHYAAHYEGRIRDLGRDHPFVLMNYDLVAVESVGAYLKEHHRAALFSGDHPQLEGPRDSEGPTPHRRYYMVVDIGGESEIPSDELTRQLEPQRDSTFGHILEVDPHEPRGGDVVPVVRIVRSLFWTGRHLVDLKSDGAAEDVANQLVAVAQHWGVVGGMIDALGVGEAVAKVVQRRYPAIEPYVATSATVSEDCYATLALLNRNRLRYYQADPAVDENRREMEQQARHTRYEIAAHERMRIVKPIGRGSTGQHIDGIKALTYAHRAVGVGPSVGVATEAQPLDRGAMNPFDDGGGRVGGRRRGRERLR